MRSGLTAAAFAAVLFSFAICGLAAPQRTLSAVENRELAAPPALSAKAVFSGRFAEDLDKYLLDHFPLRDAWAGLAGAADFAMGRKDNGRVYFGADGWLFAMDSIDFGLLDANLGHIRDFIGAVSEEYPDVAFSALPVPASWSVARDMLPAFAPAGDEDAAMSRIGEALEGFARVCDPGEDLEDAFRAGTQVYYRTDHHWTTRGAYIAYRAWAERCGLTPSPESDFAVRVVSDAFYGVNASKAGLPWTVPDRMEAFERKDAPPLRMTVESAKDGGETRVSDGLYAPEFLAERDKYAYFLGGNNAVVTIDTGLANGRTLLLLKDSFAHCFAPFLTAHFERVILVDPRYHRDGLARFFRENDITDLLFLYSAVQLSNDRNLFYLKLAV
ncbi:MAG: hypothetical protein LBP73_03045 [Clostridiales Family XIII bacterium]|jgi:hypothetical protein|nr:hypothetical protein [Clostridiales Family XIII bacterium]